MGKTTTTSTVYEYDAEGRKTKETTTVTETEHATFNPFGGAGGFFQKQALPWAGPFVTNNVLDVTSKIAQAAAAKAYTDTVAKRDKVEGGYL